MYKAIAPGAVGIRGLSLPDSIALAARHGFAGVTFDVREAATLAEQGGVGRVRALFEAAGVRPASWGLPVAWAEDRWRDDLAALPRLAAVAAELGCDRCTTWMPSGSDSRPFQANFDWHVERYLPIAEVLADHGCRFGIEFIGPRTYRARFRHEFVYSLDGLLDLARAIGTGNVGVLLDAWHVYTSGDPMSVVGKLAARDVVLVHVNDAPPGIAVDEQLDQVRALPTETGVLDLVGFMDGLRAIEYDGPVIPEPFSQRLVDRAPTDPDGVAAEVKASMDALWRVGGLT
jgi:sugar phosphate isomerase/epimerase